MDVVFEGRLTQEVQLKVVLQKIVENRPPGNLVLRISSPEQDCEGKLCIADGRFITAAILSQTHETGYTAVRKLMSVLEGNFACLRASAEDSVAIPISLNIELARVIPLMPDLPVSPDGLHDEKSLLDKVFGPGEVCEPIEPEAEEREQTQQDQTTSSNWQLLQPLIAPDIKKEAAPVRAVVEPISPGDLAKLQSLPPKNNSQNKAGKVKQAKPAALSPLAVMTIVGFFLALQLLAIIFWKPLSAHFFQKHEIRQTAASTSKPVKKQPPKKTSAKHK